MFYYSSDKTKAAHELALENYGTDGTWASAFPMSFGYVLVGISSRLDQALDLERFVTANEVFRC